MTSTVFRSGTVITSPWLNDVNVATYVTVPNNTAAIAGLGNSAGIVYTPSGTGAVTTNVQAKLRETSSVKDFGAKGDGTTDDTIAIQKAIAAVSAAGGGTVFFPTGTYKITSELIISSNAVFLTGEGRRASIIAPTAMATDFILFNAVQQGGFSNLAIVPTAAQTGTTSSAIRTYNSHNIVLDNFWIYGNCQTGVICDGGTDQFLTTVSNFEIGLCAIYGIQVGSASYYAQDTTICNGIVASCYVGINLINCSGVYVSNVDALTCTGEGISTYPATGNKVTACFFSEVLADSSTSGHGFAFIDNGGKVTDINLTNCWSATNYLSGLICSANCNGILINSSRFINNQQHGIFLQGGVNYTISSNQIGMNSMQGSALYHGIAVAANVSHFTITSNFIGGPLGAIGNLTSNLQNYGVFVSTGTSNYFNILSNDLTGNVGGAISNGGTGTTININNNLGSTVGASGVSQIVAGTNVTITPSGGTGVVTINASGSGGGTVSLTNQNDWTKTQRVTGVQIPASGVGLELAYDPSGAGVSYLASYNRSTSAWVGMNITAASIALITNNVVAATVTGSQIVNFVNSPIAPTPSTGNNTTNLATTAFVQNTVAGYTTPTAVNTAIATANTTFLATQNDWSKTQRITGLLQPTTGKGLELAFDPTSSGTAYITSYDRGSSLWLGMNLTAGSFDIATSGTTALTISSSQIANFTNTPIAPTATTGDNTTKLATTAFVRTALSSGVVTSAVAGTGIGVSAATGAVTFSNTGVTSIVAGTNVTISGSTGAVTINATGGGGGVSLTTQNDWTKTQRITGLQLPTTGSGLELAFDTTASLSYISSYNRSSSTFLGINLLASSYNFATNGNTALTISGTQVANFNNSPTMPTPSFGDNTTNGSTTAFVQTAIAGLASTSYVTSAISTATSGLASTSYVNSAIAALNRTYYGSGTTNGSGVLVITFPSSFGTSSSYSIVGICSGGYFVSVDAASASSATLTARLYSSGAATSGIPMRWMAIGT